MAANHPLAATAHLQRMPHAGQFVAATCHRIREGPRNVGCETLGRDLAVIEDDQANAIVLDSKFSDRSDVEAKYSFDSTV